MKKSITNILFKIMSNIHVYIMFMFIKSRRARPILCEILLLYGMAT